jgi:predicted double-glycine peptidase
LKRLSLASCALAALAGVSVSAAQISVGSGLRVDAPARSLKALRDEHVVKQRFDFSCGAAALATLLRYGFNEAVTEAQILLELFNRLSEDEKRTARSFGFSLLDLQQVAQGRGYIAQGFRLEPDQLPLVNGPVIVFIEPRGYKHFAVLRGVRGDRVYLADPSLGNIRMPVYAFLEAWRGNDGKGIIFVVEPKTPPRETVAPLLLPTVAGLPLPEIMAVRELQAVRAPLLRTSTRAP